MRPRGENSKKKGTEMSTRHPDQEITQEVDLEKDLEIGRMKEGREIEV